MAGAEVRGPRGMAVAIPSWVAADPEWASALYLLTTLLRLGVMEHVDFARRTIDGPRLLEVAAPWSSGERVMLRTALDLFNSGGEARLSMLVHALDDDNLQRVLDAVELRCGWLRWCDVEVVQ